MLDTLTHQKLRSARLVAVLAIDEVRHAVPTVQALARGGVKVIELTLRTPAALDSLKALVAEVPELTIGAGTVLSPAQLDEVIAAGAAFAVAPGFNAEVVKYAQSRNFPFAPGIMTPSELEGALALGCRTLKFFPAESAGGLAYLRTMAAPYLHLGIDFVPLGGVSAKNLSAYAGDPLICAVGGSWLAPKKLIQAEDWAEIERLATEANAILNSPTA